MDIALPVLDAPADEIVHDPANTVTAEVGVEHPPHQLRLRPDDLQVSASLETVAVGRFGGDELAQRSGSCGERRSNGMSELSPKGGSEGYGVCSDVMACAAGRSSVRVVPRTADVKLSRSMAFRLCSYCREKKVGFLE